MEPKNQKFMLLTFCNKIVGSGKADERVVLDSGYE